MKLSQKKRFVITLDEKEMKTLQEMMEHLVFPYDDRAVNFSETQTKEDVFVDRDRFRKLRDELINLDTGIGL